MQKYIAQMNIACMQLVYYKCFSTVVVLGRALVSFLSGFINSFLRLCRLESCIKVLRPSVVLGLLVLVRSYRHLRFLPACGSRN